MVHQKQPAGLSLKRLNDFRRSNGRRDRHKQMHMVWHYFDSKDFPMLTFRNGIQDALHLILVAIEYRFPVLWNPDYMQIQ